LSGQEDIGFIPDFATVKAAIEKEPNVESAIPMGLDSAFFSAGNEVDRVLESFRAAVKKRDPEEMQRHRAQIEQIVRLLLSELEHTAELRGVSLESDAGQAALVRVLTPEFWADLERDPEQVLQFLDTQIAPMLDEGRAVPVRYIGTDLDSFAE